MLEPNDSEINVDNAEDACKSDYFSDEGELKNDVPNTENGSSGKRKPTDIGPDEAKKVKVAADGITTLDKTAKLQSGISSNDFKRASSVASDNSDEFVDASDVLEPTSVADKTQTVTDDVDACAMKLSASSDAPKCVFESGSPKVKDKKFISRLPTFADDPLDHFNSSAIRRGFKEAEPTKPIDFNFDLSPSEKIEGKNENKTVRKVKLNRSKFFSNDKPKFSDDSSSDSNSKFNNSTSPVKTDVAPTIDNKVVPSAKVENRIAQPSVEEKPSVADELPSVSPNIVEIPKSDVESISKNEPENIPVSTENQNHSINAENTSTEPASSSYAEQKIQDETPEDQSALQIEQESEEVPEAVDTSLAPGEILDSNLDQTETEELTFEIDDLMEESFIDPISKTNDVDQEVNELPTDDNEPVPNEQIESEFESVVSELEFSSIEPETRAIDEPESLSIESEPRPDEPEPIQSDELSSPQQTKSPVLPTIENELLEQPNDQIEEIEDYVLSFNEDSLPASVESERAFISESIALQATTNSENPVPEIAEFGSTPGDEFIDLREDTQPEPESIQEPVVSEIISEPENVESERPSQNTDFDLTIESEDLADDKTEPYLSNEESEGEIEEEEEEEIHEEELYLEDRVPIVTKPNDPSPPPVLIPSPPAIKETEDVEEIIDDEREIVAQSADQVKFDSESAEQSVEPSPSLENIDDLAVEEETRRSPSVDDIETILPEQEFQNTPLSEDTEDIPTEPTIQRTPSFEDVADTPAEQTVQRIPSLENVTDIPAEEAVRRTPSLEDVTDIPVERAIERSPSFENIADISVDQSVRRTSSLEDIENIPMDIDEEPESTVPFPIPQGLSRLEQALIGKTGVKKLEIQVPLEECPVPFEIVNERASSTSADSEETKEKIKLHLSLQGDKVSIKKSPNTLVSSTSEVKARRPYRKRNKDGNLKPDKTYKLRTRSSKKDNAPAPENGQNKPVATTAVDDVIDLDADTSSKDDRIYSAEPILIDSDDSSKSGPVKIQPIKLKITKNSNVTIENASMYSDADKNRDFSEDTRKKDSIPNLMEQAATAWSGPDLQRVERLLKESNITITPVLPKESIIPQSILKPMLAAGKAKASTASKPCAPSITSTVSSSQSSSSDITPVSRDRYDDSSSGHTSPRSVDHQNGESVDHHQYRDGYDTSPSATDKQIDIKSEIRKMLASSDKRKLEPRDSTDMESDSSDSKSKSKYVPDLVPINLPTPEMLQSLATSLGTNTAAEGDPLADTSKPNIDPAFLPLLQAFPKKRGRPTKAMVAAREALKQSQEVALENLKQLATQKASEGQHIPILDITDPEDLFKTAKRGRKSRGERVDKSSDAEQSASEMTIDPEREAEEMKRLEEERIKKEEEKERRNEIRRQKARERNDLVKAKRLRQKMKAEERQKRMQEKRRKLQEEKKKLEEEIKNLPTSMPGFDDETRMSAENSQSQMISFSTGMGDEDSSNATTEFSQRVKKSRMEVTDIDSKDLTVDQIAEYQWPIQGGDLYMIQEQVSNYLGVKSFKRKYPDIKRRPVDSEERAYLVDSGLVSETLCDLGLTAVSSAELLDIMCADFPDKYEELRRYMREKQMKELSFKQKAWANGLGYKLLMADGTKQDLKKRAMESASNWNSALNKSRSDDRRCAIDLQTFIVHYPKNRARKMTIPTPKMGSYPVSILPGQFCDFYKNYTSTELRYMPINTVMYGPLKAHAAAPGDGSQTDSDDSSSSDESSTTSEGTQNTEDTIEDTDKDMSVDESSLLDKSHDLNLLKEQMTMELSENTRELIMDEAAKILCKVCLGNITRNKENVPEVLIYCSQCSSTSHPSCLDLSLDMVPHIKKYAWQCPDCKSCARCKENADEDKMLFCDICDRGYHIYCVGLKKVPSGRWQCQECTTVENNSCINNSTPVREVFKEPGILEMQEG